MFELIRFLIGVISRPYSCTVTPLEGTRVVKTSIGRHFGTAERTLSRLECVFFSPCGHRIFIELQKSTLKPTFYQKVLPEFVAKISTLKTLPSIRGAIC